MFTPSWTGDDKWVNDQPVLRCSARDRRLDQFVWLLSSILMDYI